MPVCTDCHGAHSQDDPTTAAFRLKSPDICGKCHADAALMKKYGISTDVFNTYVADFHGTTVTLFEKQHPDQPTNKAVCTDCHGVHDIMQVTAANASVVKENLLTTCRRCHPDATTNFPDSWVGHFPPSRDRFPLVYYVNLFYKILIPAVIGGMALFVGIDAVRRIINRFRRKENREGSPRSQCHGEQANTVSVPVQIPKRFSVLQRVEHIVLIVSFTTLGAHRAGAEVFEQYHRGGFIELLGGIERRGSSITPRRSSSRWSASITSSSWPTRSTCAAPSWACCPARRMPGCPRRGTLQPGVDQGTPQDAAVQLRREGRVLGDALGHGHDGTHRFHPLEPDRRGEDPARPVHPGRQGGSRRRGHPGGARDPGVALLQRAPQEPQQEPCSQAR